MEDQNDIAYYVYGYKIDYFRLLFRDVESRRNFRYIDDPVRVYCKNEITKFLYLVCKHPRINKLFGNIVSHMWEEYYVPKLDNFGEKVCFIFFMRWLKPSNRFIFEKIKSTYPKAKIVIYFEDLYSTGVNSLDYSIINDFSDLVISYDQEDASRHGFEYHPTFMTTLNEVDAKNIQAKNDVSYIGAAKHRYDEIVKAYDIMTEMGHSCDFIVSRLLKGQKKFNGIHYISYLIPYTEYLKRTLHSKYILELMQDGASGYTLRTWEAILYHKALITNNKAILKAPFYNPEQFIYFENVEDLRQLKIPDNYHACDSHFCPSSSDFLNFIKNSISW